MITDGILLVFQGLINIILSPLSIISFKIKFSLSGLRKSNILPIPLMISLSIKFSLNGFI